MKKLALEIDKSSTISEHNFHQISTRTLLDVRHPKLRNFYCLYINNINIYKQLIKNASVFIKSVIGGNWQNEWWTKKFVIGLNLAMDTKHSKSFAYSEEKIDNIFDHVFILKKKTMGQRNMDTILYNYVYYMTYI